MIVPHVSEIFGSQADAPFVGENGRKTLSQIEPDRTSGLTGPQSRAARLQDRPEVGRR